MKKEIRNQRNNQLGMTLIEVLVSMLVIGLALAMSISMIQTANRFGENAEFSSSALRQAQAIVDKIRANNANANSYTFLGGAVLTPNSSFNDLYNNVDMSTITACTIDCSVAERDMLQWRDELAALLPGGRGMIVPSGNRRFDVIVMWRYNLEKAEINDQSIAQGVRISFSL